MAQLPPDGQYLIQQIDGEVVLFERDTERVLLRFPANDGDAVAKAQLTIFERRELNVEQKCFAHFWSGYFYGHATGFRQH